MIKNKHNKVKVGFKWKSIEGPCKGEWFVVTHVDADKVEFKKLKQGNNVYIKDRTLFCGYIERVNKHWREQKLKFKSKKKEMY